MRCLGTQFRPDESVIAVEDTPELNYQHPYFRSLVSRTANTEGVGEVTLQEHIKTTLRLCPTRVILGEMRTPEAAEAFLEAAQTGHSGMSTIHARNARETLTRLESLLGRAQRGVGNDIIRQQIALAVDVVIWNCRERVSGKVRMAEVIEVGHFVEGQIQVRPMFKLVREGDAPQWEVLSYSSFYEHVLEQNGIYLGDAPKFIGFSVASNVPSTTSKSG
jgi:pilus assembly protein CpaF